MKIDLLRVKFFYDDKQILSFNYCQFVPLPRIKETIIIDNIQYKIKEIKHIYRQDINPFIHIILEKSK